MYQSRRKDTATIPSCTVVPLNAGDIGRIEADYNGGVGDGGAETVDSGGDQRVPAQGDDIEQGGRLDQWTEPVAAQIEQAEDHVHDQIAGKPAEALVEVIAPADQRRDPHHRQPGPAGLAQPGKEVGSEAAGVGGTLTGNSRSVAAVGAALSSALLAMYHRRVGYGGAPPATS